MLVYIDDREDEELDDNYGYDYGCEEEYDYDYDSQKQSYDYVISKNKCYSIRTNVNGGFKSCHQTI